MSIQDCIFIAGDSPLSHPVSNLFQLGETTDRGEPSAQALADKRLVVTDCRLVPSERLAGWLDEVLGSQTPLLALCPSVDHLAALATRIPLTPTTPSAALLVVGRKNPNGATSFDLRALNYTAVPSQSRSSEAPSQAAEHAKAPQGPPQGAGPTDFDLASLSGTLVDPAAADHFKTGVVEAMETTDAVETTLDEIPSGVNYFQSTFLDEYYFTYEANGRSNKSQGRAAYYWTVKGFLSEAESGNSQYLVVDGRWELEPGILRHNNSGERGFVDNYLKSRLDPPAPLKRYDFAPADGSGHFAGTVTIPISYWTQLTGYKVWDYTDSVDDTVSSWRVRSISEGSKLGAQWCMKSPVDGCNIEGSWKKAFDFWGNVKSMPAASKGLLRVHSISAWVTDTLLRGNVTVPGYLGWEGSDFYNSGLNTKIHVLWTWFDRYPRFTVNFDPIANPNKPV